MYLLNQRSPAFLGGLGYRPNQAIARTYTARKKISGLGQTVDVAVDPTLLFAGLGVLAVAFLLIGGKKVKKTYRRAKRRRIQAKRAKLQAQLMRLGEA